MSYDLNIIIGMFLLRVLLGILFLFQGYDKIFNMGLRDVCDTLDNEYEKLSLPRWLVSTVIFLSSFTELIGGIFLILGFFKSYVLYALGLDLLVVAFGFTIIKPMWDMQYFFPRFAILIALLLLPAEWDQWSLDMILNLMNR